MFLPGGCHFAGGTLPAWAHALGVQIQIWLQSQQ